MSADEDYKAEGVSISESIGKAMSEALKAGDSRDNERPALSMASIEDILQSALGAGAAPEYPQGRVVDYFV